MRKDEQGFHDYIFIVPATHDYEEPCGVTRMEKGSFLVGLDRRRLSFPLTSPMMRRADSDDDEEMPANLANEKDNVGIVVTEETLVAQMARLRAHGLYSPVAQQIIPTPSTKRPSLLSRRASGPSPSRRGDEAEEEELAATTPSRLRRRRRLKLSSATPLRRRNRRRDTLLGSEGKDGGAPLAPQPPPSATAPSAADDPPEETSRETGVLEEVSAVTLLPEKESSRLDAQSIQRDALTSTLDGVGDSRSDVQEHAEEPVLEENVDESSQWPKVNRSESQFCPRVDGFLAGTLQETLQIFSKILLPLEQPTPGCR